MPEKTAEHTNSRSGVRFELVQRAAEHWAIHAILTSGAGVVVGHIRYGEPARRAAAIPSEVWDIYALHVVRPWRGLGIASGLHRRALEHAQSLGRSLRALARPARAHGAVFEKLRAHRVAFEGGERFAGVSATDPDWSPGRSARRTVPGVE